MPSPVEDRDFHGPCLNVIAVQGVLFRMCCAPTSPGSFLDLPETVKIYRVFSPDGGLEVITRWTADVSSQVNLP